MSNQKLKWKGKTFASALALLVAFTGFYEGRRLLAYQDVTGKWTICDGYTHGVKKGDTATDAQCDVLLNSTLQSDLQTARKMLPSDANPYVQVVTADMIYQFGEGKVRNSTMVKKFARGDKTGGCRELNRWVNAVYKGKFQPMPGIVKRRADATQLCMQTGE